MDKAHMKLLLRAHGLEVGEYEVVRAGTDARLLRDRCEHLGLPVFVKPARGGSSLGITRVTDWDDLCDAVENACELGGDPKVLVEAAIVGREIECGVLGGLHCAPPEASVPAEIRVRGGHEFYDFEAKYLDGTAEFDVPAKVDDDTFGRLRQLAVRAFEALDCEGLARVDFFLRADGSILVNEVHTMPGFTPQSLFPRMWAATGVEYPALVDRLLLLALERGTGLR
jgi:D-alanine-D-alanine ligase